jgi:hypothetical protein
MALRRFRRSALTQRQEIIQARLAGRRAAIAAAKKRRARILAARKRRAKALRRKAALASRTTKKTTIRKTTIKRTTTRKTTKKTTKKKTIKFSYKSYSHNGKAALLLVSEEEVRACPEDQCNCECKICSESAGSTTAAASTTAPLSTTSPASTTSGGSTTSPASTTSAPDSTTSKAEEEEDCCTCKCEGLTGTKNAECRRSCNPSQGKGNGKTKNG